MFNKKILTIMLMVLFFSSFADQYEFVNDDASALGNLVQDNIQDKQIIINKTYYSFSEFINKLHNMGFTTKILSSSMNILNNININFKGSNKDFILLVANKFGYKSLFNDENYSYIEFIALNPVKPKPVVITITRNIKDIKPILSVPIKPVLPIWNMNVSDKTLRNTLSKWCKQANWQLFWKVRGDTPIQANWSIQGNFEHAINEVLKASQYTELPLKASMFDGNKVLEISSGQ